MTAFITMNDDMYKTCLWCTWFQSGRCVNKNAFDINIDMNNDIYFSKFTEEGHLSGAIEEGFGNIKFSSVEQKLLESKLSKKAQAEIMKTLYEELEDMKVHLIERIDESVSSALNNFDFSSDGGGVYIANPNEFYCKYFW